VFESIGGAVDKADPADAVGAVGAVDTVDLVVLYNAYLRVVIVFSIGALFTAMGWYGRTYFFFL